jgi:hypothetical protein
MVPPFQMFILEGTGIEVNREWRDSLARQPLN